MPGQFDYAAFGLQPPRHRIDPPVGPRDVASLVPRAKALVPNNEALADDKVRYTFSELDEQVTRTAGFFRDSGLEPGDRIAMSVLNRVEAVVAFFAAMQFGLVWVGMNRILPPADKKFILAHSGTKLMLADTISFAEIEALKAELPELMRLVDIDSDPAWVSALSCPRAPALPWPEIDPFVPAAIMYTSGTTGVPKGVVHSQHNMVTVAAGNSAHGLMSPEARRGSALPVTITNVMILGPVFSYWNLQPFSLGQTTRIEPMIEWLHKEGIGQIPFVPTMVYDLLQADLDLPEKLVVGCGGAPVAQPIREKFRTRYGYPLETSYGLTEAPTIVATSNGLVGPDGASGLAAPYLQITIRDKAGCALSPETIGEVCMGAIPDGPWANVYTPPLGYWRDAVKTAELLKDGLVHTGDVGSLDEDGWLTIADRSSELILRGGSNVYPAEIERVLHMLDSVADCAIIGQPDERLGMKTVAFVQRSHPAAEEEALQAELRAQCLEHLSRYKVPDEWIIVDEFPRNAMGKIIKPRLREMLAGNLGAVLRP
ncbi:MAG: class I adenylate-forming enzyme family protein [Sphingorhabdus sp.]